MSAGRGDRLAGWVRAGLIGFAALLATTLVVARRLEPDRRGFGTHEQLGLPPCAFRAVTGQPCPTCGMTTAFAWSTRFEPRRSIRANPAGNILVGVAVALIPWLLIAAARGEPWPFRTLERPVVALAVAVACLTVGSWIVRLVFEWMT